jgi:predicted amidohydrolase
VTLVSLQFQTTQDFEQNLETLISNIKETALDSFVVAPELCLNGYAYDHLDQAVKISNKAIEKLLDLSKNRLIATTLTTKKENNYFNTLHLFYNNKIIHTQSKNKLFVLNDEKKYFSAGDINDIKIIDLDGLKIGFMICFELRFIEFWQKLQGADIICIPSMWGEPRKEHFETLTKALAIANQCYVIASNSSNIDMASSSGIITPFGKELRDDKQTIIECTYDTNEIKKMRRYMNIGLK